MSKGSGGNRKSSSSKPAATSLGGGKAQTLKQAMSVGFSSDGMGTYVLETEHGGGQIDQSTASYNSYKYGKETVYHATPWDADYKMGEKRVFSDLNAAKKYIKGLLK